MTAGSDQFSLYDLRVEVIEGRGRMLCHEQVGDYFEVHGGRIAFPTGQGFPLYAMAALLDSDFVAAAKCVHAAVECGGTLARGALAIEWYAQSSRAPNVRLVTKANLPVMLAQLERAFPS